MRRTDYTRGLPPEKTPTTTYDYYCVIDFEATCEADHSFDFMNEIIEFPAVLLDGSTFEEVDVFHTYVRPVQNPKLSAFCITLTGIEQSTVDSAPVFTDALQMFASWMASHNILTEKTIAFVTDGPWDLRDFMRKQCVISGIQRPTYFDSWINLRRVRHRASIPAHAVLLTPTLHSSSCTR